MKDEDRSDRDSALWLLNLHLSRHHQYYGFSSLPIAIERHEALHEKLHCNHKHEKASSKEAHLSRIERFFEEGEEVNE